MKEGLPRSDAPRVLNETKGGLEGNEVRSRAGALSRGSELVEPQHEFLDLG